MATNSPQNIDYTTIDFDSLKAELVRYMRETKTFKDVDFSSSNINALIGLYAYMGSLYGYYINAVANEPFLPTAKRYKNLNRIARLLSYDPRGYKAATIDVVGSLLPEYCYGKEGKYIEIPAYSLFPSTKRTPAGQEFSFTNPDNLVYLVKGFGIRPVEQSDFSYNGSGLPYTAPKSFWETQGTSATPSLDPQKIELNLSDTKPLTILNRTETSKYKGYDVDYVPLFTASDSLSVGQPFTRNISVKSSTIRFIPEKNYYIVFSYDTEQSKPSLEILEEGDILEETKDRVMSVIRLVKSDSAGEFYTLKEIQNNSKEKFYVGVLGMQNLESVDFSFDKLEAFENAVKQIHIDINRDGSMPPFQVLVNGEIYSFKAGRISSQIFEVNTWDVNQDYYNVNLTIVTPAAPEYNYDAKLNVTSKEPGINEVTIARIYPSFVDQETQTPTIMRESGQRFGNFKFIPPLDVTTNEQKSGVVDFSDGMSEVFVAFDSPFTQPSSGSVEYIISLTPSENVQVWFTNKSEAGFSINVEPNSGFSGDVSWIATKVNQTDVRSNEVVFDSPIPSIAGMEANYSIFLTPSENVKVWYEDKTPAGFKIQSERAFSGTVSYSTVVFSSDQSVIDEKNSATQKRGYVTLSGNVTTKSVTFDSEFGNNEYGLHMIANKNVNVWYTNKTPSGFVINVDSTDGNVDVDWFADYSPVYKYQKHGTVKFGGQVTSAGTMPGLRFANIPETFIFKDLKQGIVRFSSINKNGVIDIANNGLQIAFAADRTSVNEIKFQIGNQNISYSDIRLFVKNTGGDWEEWNNASDLAASANIDVGEKVFFARVEDTKNVEITFGNGVDYGTDPKGNEIIIFGLETVGKDGNIPPNTLSDSVILSRDILGDDNITLQFEQQFIQLLGLKSSTYFAANEKGSPTSLYDSEGTKIDSNTLTILQDKPAFGGAFPETTEELRSNASSANLRQDRIVSIDDYATFVESAFNDIVLRAKALSYDEAVESGFVKSDDSKYFFNYIFLVLLPQEGVDLSKKQKDYILESLGNKFKAMATVEHEIFSAELVPIDVRVRFKPTRSGGIVSIKTGIEKAIRDFFARENRSMGENLHQSDIVKEILETVSNVDFIELTMNKDKGDKFKPNDYITGGVTDINETVAEVKRKKILEILAKDPSLVSIVEPLLSVKDTKTNVTSYPFTLNVKMEKYEFPILGDIVIELDQGSM